MQKVGKQIEKSVKSVESLFKKVLGNKNLRNILLVLLVIYSIFFANKLPENLRNFLKSMQGKLVVLLLIVYFAYNDVSIAILLAVAYVVSNHNIENMDNNNKGFFDKLWSKIKKIFTKKESTNNAAANNDKANNAKANNAPANNAKANNAPANNAKANDAPANNAPANNVPANNQGDNNGNNLEVVAANSQIILNHLKLCTMQWNGTYGT